jgi:hypothetical protein
MQGGGVKSNLGVSRCVIVQPAYVKRTYPWEKLAT